MGEIEVLKQQKEGLIKDMINNKQSQMEDDHKLFQQKLDELKNSMLQDIKLPKKSPVLAKGTDILAELDRMKERLQRGRNNYDNPRQHPSEKVMHDIIINNPLADKEGIDQADYFPEKKPPQDYMDKSLPGITDLKTGLNASQNYKSENENIDKTGPQDEDSVVNIESHDLEKPKHKKHVIRNQVNFNFVNDFA